MALSATFSLPAAAKAWVPIACHACAAAALLPPPELLASQTPQELSCCVLPQCHKAADHSWGRWSFCDKHLRRVTSEQSQQSEATTFFRPQAGVERHSTGSVPAFDGPRVQPTRQRPAAFKVQPKVHSIFFCTSRLFVAKDCTAPSVSPLAPS